MQYSTRKTFTYTWTIQNSAHCWHKEGELLNSPAFFVDTLERTKWYLRIFPRGNFEKGFSTVYLRRDSADFGPDSIKLGYKISFLAENGLPIRTKEIKEHSFTKNHGYGALELLTWDDMFLHQGEVTIRCEMWASEYEISESGHCRATTKIEAVQRSFVWDIKNFSVLGSNRKKSMQMKCISTGASQITFDFCLTEGLGCEENMYMETVSELCTKDQILCDVQLRTNTDIFPCHRSILSARSAVFRTMFSTDMAEKNSDYVDVPDLDDDTVHQMLLYLYTDTMKELDWDSACHLYEVSDKYQLLDLKNKCLIFFKTKNVPLQRL
ncbi:speckle-type POZ protein B [Caerostris extrusa]|uniref:Speckle-type POZ protein B n=1 Tax=Caerostris extrusa TaxID=172846 RepID=A0AAV4WMT5_CAEEX|nr:speckle-type POZ protein B [Caerostris extrusa]